GRRRERREGGGRLLPVAQVWIGQAGRTDVASLERLVQADQPFGRREGKRLDQDAIHHAEQSGVDADARGETGDDDRGNCAILQKATEGVAECPAGAYPYLFRNAYASGPQHEDEIHLRDVTWPRRLVANP